MNKIFKVVWGAGKSKVFKTIDKARAFRNKKSKNWPNVVLQVREKDVNPYEK